ncbi:PIN domain-containing protein [Treponema endosymbiont of Eucomonympha sp.]|uniref:PIN domain-containing protein n=2 Tax=Treponema endosymbiont of Eucomonympha sp. TaxID=1580831 RepID=UPI000782ED2E|nr:PIN domain-containing protein [Treponema endosymbiont of Eucomonympha sp.]
MSYFLDSDTCVYYLNGAYPALSAQFKASRPQQIKIPAMVMAEMLTGAAKGARMTRGIWAQFAAPFEIVPFGGAAARQYAAVRAYLEKNGESIGPNDLVIAATVLANGGVLITRNTKEFSRVPPPDIEDWTI